MDESKRAKKYSRFRAAAVQAASVLIDEKATVEKACALIREAADKGAQLVVFPESFIPTYPFWIWLGSPAWAAPYNKEFFLNSVDIPSPTVEQLCEAARAAGTYLAIGVSEKEGGTLYNTILFIDRYGKLIGKHRKLKPTLAERMVWGEGDGSHLVVIDTELGKLGGLICAEHMMDLARYALYSMGEQVHVALWPAISALKHNPRSALFNTFSEAACIHHAVANSIYVVSSYSVVDRGIIDKLGLSERPDMIVPGVGRTAIFGPNGETLAGPLLDEEGIVYADLDLELSALSKLFIDAVGHYARPDVLRLIFNRERREVLQEQAPVSDSNAAQRELIALAEQLRGRARQSRDRELFSIAEELLKKFSAP